MSLGPVMVDIPGTSLTAEDRERLRHPQVGGVILFTRNYESRAQLRALSEAIHALRSPRLLIAVDQEGGRVQRFRDDFTPLPPVRRLGNIYDENPRRARRLAELTGWLMAMELRGVGVDFSFAPVVDLDRGTSAVIGDRAFHGEPEVVADLAHAYMLGMGRAGMAATVKHFPGHGSVAADSHAELPVDDRTFADIAVLDLVPFERMVHYGVAGVMAAHLLVPHVDPLPVGYSKRWLNGILRQQLEFRGIIFSDDLCMAGAAEIGDITARGRTALEAGCDMVLVCNDSRQADILLDTIQHEPEPAALVRLARMHGRGRPAPDAAHHDPSWREALAAVRNYA